MVVGLLVGLRVNSETGAETPPRASAAGRSTAKAKPSAAKAKPTRRSTVALDLGAPGTRIELTGPWKPQHRLDGRRVALMTGRAGGMVVDFAPPDSGYVAAAVAKAVGVEAPQRLDVTVSLGGRRVAHWSLCSAWTLQVASLGDGPFRDGKLAFELATSESDRSVEGRAEARAVALDSLQVLRPQQAAHLDLGTAEGRSRLLSGFYQVEGVDSDQPTVWSEGLRSTLGMLLDPTPQDYRLGINAHAFHPVVPLRTEVLVNGRPAGEVVFGKERKEYTMRVPRSLLAVGANKIELGYARNSSPAKAMPGSRDARHLALRLAAVTLEPVAP